MGFEKKLPLFQDERLFNENAIRQYVRQSWRQYRNWHDMCRHFGIKEQEYPKALAKSREQKENGGTNRTVQTHADEPFDTSWQRDNRQGRIRDAKFTDNDNSFAKLKRPKVSKPKRTYDAVDHASSEGDSDVIGTISAITVTAIVVFILYRAGILVGNRQRNWFCLPDSGNHQPDRWDCSVCPGTHCKESGFSECHAESCLDSAWKMYLCADVWIQLAGNPVDHHFRSAVPCL